MSAYLVKDKTINRVVTWLVREVSISHFTLDHLAWEHSVDLASDRWEEKLAVAMFQLNCDGVTACYGEGEAEKFRPLHFTYIPEPDASFIQVLKSLQCWLYQCEEGDVPQTNLYKFFAEVESYLALKIVMDLPEYDKALWE